MIIGICVQNSTATVKELGKLSVQELEKHAAKSELKVLIVGKPGIGKHTLMITLFGEGKKCSSINEAMMCNSLFTINGVTIQVTMMDSPDSIHSIELELDLAIVAIRMDDTRYRGDDQVMLLALSRKFGPTVWNKCLIALTFANRVTYVNSDTGKEERSIEHLMKKGKHWVNSIHSTLKAEGIAQTILHHLPTIPVGHPSKFQLHDNTESWKMSLLKCIIVRLQKSGMDASAAMWQAMKDTIPDESTIGCKVYRF